MNTVKPKNLEKILKALANRRRIEIIQFLKVKREAFVGDIAERIHVSLKSTSRHLSVLFAAGIIEKTQRNIWVYYKIANDTSEVARRVISFI